MSVWFITGASRGFGLAIAREALARGESVVATARNPQTVLDALPDAGDRLLAVALDVTDADAARAAADTAIERFGRIDVLVNNAGRGLLGAVEEVSDEEVREVFDINVFGLLSVTRAVLPHMRARRSGLVINLSSVGGIVVWPGWGAYAATKFAVEALSEAMTHELAPLGIRAVAIEPGPFRTDFLAGSSLQLAQTEIEDYADSGGAARQWAVDNNNAQEGDPVKAAKVIVDLADAPELPERIQLGTTAFNGVAAKLAQTAADQQRWRDVSLSTDYDLAPTN
ncbi:short-chain dehydrogenase/reductase [Mycolicibacterium agri]|uniref:Short-chain dehydrogenase/reductase n=1 Tax=Mycolicibacterium agri TaxID=36811 RepID=A0A2A7MYB8_MYCAG|nr:oxidoreductase [Mycolicibacterium agri]PEG36497.1 short-chain dehydrogenase/reductase [Mycolicibacterium agri]GFG49570.1 short-chain dehydrogenase/reductase [Mycolicibacterium agri]